MLTVDGRCGCPRCVARTENIYRMVGTCLNCGTKPILMIFRAGDPTAKLDCPRCDNRSVESQRIAGEDEIPADAHPGAPVQPKESSR